MIIEERKSYESNLESIDSDLRLENVRQNAEKLGWDHFARSVRRNLQEKRQTLEARIRLDVLGSLAFMKEHLPIDKEASVTRKLQYFAEGLGENCVVSSHGGYFCIKNPDVTIEIGVAEDNVSSCKIGYFGQPLFDAPEALKLMKAGDFSKFRDAVANILSSLPKEITVIDRNACKDAFRALEHVLIRDAADSSFSAINSSKYGFYSPRTDLLPGRLYYVAEPMLVRLAEKEGKSHADNSHLDLLPFIEISFVKNDKQSKLPVFDQSGEWTSFNDANVCICVKFNHGFLFSQHTIRKLAPLVPKAPLVRNYVNYYRYTSGRSSTKSNLKLLTQFPDSNDVQQFYDIDSSKLTKEDDAVVVEMFLSDMRDLPKFIETLRSEWKHGSMWESILAMCESKQEPVQKNVLAVNFQLALRRNEFNLQFDSECGTVTMKISEKNPGQYAIQTRSHLTGDSLSEEVDKMLAEKLNCTWSIPITLTFAVSPLKCHLKNMLSPLNCANSSGFDSDKLQRCWLGSSKTKQSNKQCAVKKNEKVMIVELGPVIEPEKLVYTRENDEELRGSLLSSFGEVDPYYEQTSTIGKTSIQPRPKQEPSQLASMDMMSAELDMDKGRQSIENAMYMRPQDVQRMSFLESARVHMKQSIGAAHAVGLASHQPHHSPGGPMRHHSYTMGFDSPAPYDPNIPASLQFPDPSTHGKGKQRKPRAKKQQNEDGMAPAGRGKGRKGRGAGAVGAGGGRKSSGVAANENPFQMDPMRPPLQRSFSDFPGQMNPQQMQYQQMQHMQQMHHYQQNQQFQQNQQYQHNQQQQYRMHMQQQQQQQHQQMLQQQQQHQMQSPQHSGMNTPKSQQAPSYTDEESDEDYDPPRLPKPQVSAASRSSLPPPQQLGNPMVGYPGMPLQSPNHLPLTPSPLSAPPKPFSPEQQHFGMKMRENAYWKELDRLDIKPDLEALKRETAMKLAAVGAPESASASSLPGPTSTDTSIASTDSQNPAPPINKPPTSAPTPKKKLGLEAAISKIRGQQEQALQKQQQQQFQQQDSVESTNSEQPTPQPLDQHPGVSQQLAPNQMNRARNMNGIFDDEAEENNSNNPDVKMPLSALRKALAPPMTDSSTPGSSSSFVMPNLKKEPVEEEPEREKEKLIVKIPKFLKLAEDRKEERREKDRDRDRDGDRDRERSEKDDKVQKEKDKREREKEKRRQRDRDRAEQKKAEKESIVGKEKDQSSSKKRKLDKKEEKDRREPEKKKGKNDGKEFNKTTTTTTTSMIPTLSLKTFRIPKKDTAYDDKKEVKEDASASGPSTSSESSIRKEVPAAPVTRKESTSVVSSVPIQRKESFTSQSGPPPDNHREPPSKKKPVPSMNGPPAYPGPSNISTMPSNIRGSNINSGGRKPPMAPPPPMMRGPPSDQIYRERTGSMRGFPPSSHYHGSGGGGGSKQVASYAQGLPPGMGPPAVKPHGNNYQASQWVRPPTHRDSHSYHGMPSLGPPQLQREPPPPPPQMIPLPREQPPVLREHPKEHKVRSAEDGPDSPEEGTLRIDDE